MPAVIVLTTGEPGAGKSYIRASRFLVDDFLINSDGRHISNFPLNVDLIADEVTRKMNFSRTGILSKIVSFFGVRRRKVNADDIKKRIVVIPGDVLKCWNAEQSGPWDYFAETNLVGAHIAIDEIQEYVSYGKSPEYLQKWDEFLGQIRHRGCTIEGITQDFKSVHPVFANRAGIRNEIFTAENMRDPFFSIPFYDWYNLKACFTGCFHKTSFQVEKRKSVSGRWVVNQIKRFLLVPEYFIFYNSYNASLQEKEMNSGAVSENRVPLYEFQKRGKFGLFFWFVYRNFFSLFSRFAIVAVFIWMCFFGGFVWCFNWFTSSVAAYASPKKKTLSVQKKSDPNLIVSGSSVQVEIPSSGSSPPSQVQAEIVLPDASLYRPVFFDDESVYLAGGLRLRVGYIFNKGSRYEGKRVISIDSRSRVYVLSDGTTIGMQHVTY